MERRADGNEVSGRQLNDELLPLAPFLYLAWADGALTATELELARERAGASLDAPARAALRRWLDPADPPTAEELAGLLEQLRARPDVLAAADVGGTAERIRGAGASAALDAAVTELEHALGIHGAEATRAVRGPVTDVRDDGDETTSRSRYRFDPAALNAFLDREHADIRRRVLEIVTRDEFAYVDERDTAAYRETVLGWCRTLADAGLGALAFPEVYGGRGDVAASVAAFETLAYHDISLLVKYGVQFGLFGGSIYLLGTERHHAKYLRDVASLALPGCFAMTETGHGSNVRDLRTTAVYDPASEEFVIHTPTRDARKDYIGNAAAHGRLAVVFAQLRTGSEEHGIHAFLVPIRDEAGDPMPGVHIEDCGLKVGLNGVDNGRLHFDNVRIPRANLLDRYGTVEADGHYLSPIASPGRRFFTMIGTLVAGRISIAGASVSAAKSGLTIAVRYTNRRRQFGPEGSAEVPLLDYLTMQRRLLPRVATAYALDFAMDELVRRFALRTERNAQEIETLAAALKAYASDWAADTLRECREGCGGQGYMAVNRLGRLRADTDVFTTFEGANHVLYQLVARGRLTEYRAQFGELRLWSIARYLAGRAAARVTELNPIITRRTDPEHLRDPAFHAAALRYREDRLVASLGRRLKSRLDEGMDSFDAMNECQDHLVEVGVAFTERWVTEAFAAAVEACPDDGLRVGALEPLAALWGLSRLEARSGWLLEAGYLEPAKSRAIRHQVNELCRELRPVAVDLVEAFGIPDRLLAAPIATGS